MSSLCAILRGSFDDYRNEALPAPQRRILREHLAACPACRDLASAEDPTLLFARSIHEEIPEAEQQQILAAVRMGVALMETERRIGWSSRRRLASVAAAAAVAALVFSSPGSAPPPSPGTRLAVAAASQSAPVAAGIVAPVAAQESVLDPAGLAEQVEPASSNATVYDLNPGAGRGEPRVVWIVDRGLDI